MLEPISAVVGIIAATLKTWEKIDDAIKKVANAKLNLDHWEFAIELLRNTHEVINERILAHPASSTSEAKLYEAITHHVKKIQRDLNIMEGKMPKTGRSWPGQSRLWLAFVMEIRNDKELGRRLDSNIILMSHTMSVLQLYVYLLITFLAAP